MISLGFHVTTLGCKLNQFDSAELSGSLRGAVTGVADPSSAHLIVVNTCTVTMAADADARQILRRRRRESPSALIVATGCYAERDPRALEALPEVDLVLRREDRPRAARLILGRLRERFPGQLDDGCAERDAESALPDFGDRSRAFLRVQEGCDLVCSYCVIPAVRGRSRSVPPDEVERRFAHLLEGGFREIVLTGVNTGDYGRDLSPRLTLVSLLDRLTALPGDFRIRLNSVEPRRVTPDLVERIAADPKIARHLQVPLQSGSGEVLRAMRRNYRPADYRSVIEGLRDKVPDAGIGADVIAGFPTEGRSDFEETRRVLEACAVSFLHVFTWSPRPGTEAVGFAPGAGPAERKRRTAELRSLGRRLTESFVRSQAGRVSRSLVLAGRRDDGRTRALTSNFIEVAIEEEAPANAWRDVVITGFDGGVARGALAPGDLRGGQSPPFSQPQASAKR